MCTKAGGLSAAGASPCRAAAGCMGRREQQEAHWNKQPGGWMDLTAQTATGKQATHHEFLPLRLRRASYTRTSPDYLFWHMLATCARARARSSLTAKIRWGWTGISGWFNFKPKPHVSATFCGQQTRCRTSCTLRIWVGRSCPVTRDLGWQPDTESLGVSTDSGKKSEASLFRYSLCLNLKYILSSLLENSLSFPLNWTADRATARSSWFETIWRILFR